MLTVLLCCIATCFVIWLITFCVTFIVNRFKSSVKWFRVMRIVSLIVLAISSFFATWDYIDYLNNAAWSGIIAIFAFWVLILPSILMFFISVLGSYLYKRHNDKSA